MFLIFLKLLLLLMLWPGVGKSREAETEICTKFKRFQSDSCSKEDPVACREQFMTENQLSHSEIEQLNECASEKSEPEPESRKKRVFNKIKEMGGLAAGVVGEMGAAGGMGDSMPPSEEPPVTPPSPTVLLPQPVVGQPGTQASQSPSATSPSPPVKQKPAARFQETVKAAHMKAKEGMHTQKKPPESSTTSSSHPSPPKRLKTVAQAAHVHTSTRKKKEEHTSHVSKENQEPQKEQRIEASQFKRVALTARANKRITQSSKPSTKPQPPSTKKH